MVVWRSHLQELCSARRLRLSLKTVIVVWRSRNHLQDFRSRRRPSVHALWSQSHGPGDFAQLLAQRARWSPLPVGVCVVVANRKSTRVVFDPMILCASAVSEARARDVHT